MRVGFAYTGCHSLLISLGADSASPGLAGPSCGPPLSRARGPNLPRVPRQRSRALPQHTASHPLSDQRTLVCGWRLRPGWPA